MNRKRIGPYTLVDPIGRGGMGVVYRAVHRETGAEVALKTVRVPNAEVLGCVRREILALARLDHPGVVRILDHGLDGGLPWYAMSLVSGASLRDRFAALRRDRRGTSAYVIDLDTDLDALVADDLAPAASADERSAAVRILHRLCQTLAYVHGEGVVHLDLKPENVIVTPDDLPVLVDFGLAARFAGGRGRDTLDLTTPGSGTIAYMAPEQIAGGAVDARTDLYAVGCMLFELLAGRRPFLGKGTAVAIAHLGREPVAPSSLVAGLPPELDALVLGLLAKNPADRVGYAEDVARTLSRIGVDAPSWGPPPRAYVYRAGFAGREAPRTEIDRDVARLATGAGRIVLVGGESGVGKTRLATEVARSAREDEVLVLLGDCDPLGVASAGAAAPLNGLREPLRAVADRCRAVGPYEVERVFGPRAKVLADYEPALLALHGVEGYSDPAPLDADSARLRVFATLADVLEAVAIDRPTLLVLDDLQWADELTLGFLRFLARGGRLESTPLLVLATFRDDEAGPEIEALADAPGVNRIDLGRLDEREVSKIVGGMLALSPPPERLCRDLHRASEGNPFFVTEYLRSAVEGGALRRDAASSWRTAGGDADARLGLEMPASLRDLVARRLDDLSAEATDVLHSAAVFGRSISLRLLLNASRRSEAETLEAITELVRRHAVREARPGELEFTHDKVREAAYERIPAADRAALHRAAAEALEADGGEDATGARAEHWELAGEPERAGAAYLVAARRATKAYANAEAERFYRALLRVAEPSHETTVARNELAALLAFTGKVDEACDEYELALASARARGDRRAEAESLLGIGIAHRQPGRNVEAREAVEAALDLAREVGDRGLEATVLGQLGVFAHYEGSSETALVVGREALDAHAEVGDVAAFAAQAMHVATTCWTIGRYAEAEALIDEAAVRFRELGDLAGEARAATVRGTIRLMQGWAREALRFYESGLAMYRSAGARAGEGLVLMNMSGVSRSIGDLEGSLRHTTEAIAVLRETGSRINEGNALANAGNALLDLGRFDEARATYDASLAALREAGSPLYEANTIGYYGTYERKVGSFEEAAARYETALSIHRACGNTRGAAVTLSNMAQLSADLGRSDEARARFGTALDLFRGLGMETIETEVVCEIAELELSASDGVVPSPEPIEGALAAARAEGLLVREGVALRLLATIERRSGGDLAAAEANALAAEAVARRIGDPCDRIDCLCELARVTAARGAPAADYLAAATEIVERLGLRPSAPHAARVERLRVELSRRD